MGSALICSAILFPTGLLWVLGKNYQHLRNEVLLIAAGGALGALSSVMLSLNAAKGWVKYYWLNIPCMIAIQIILLLFLQRIIYWLYIQLFI